MSDENIQKNNIILYPSDEGAAIVEVLYKDETMWLTQKTMAKLFDVNRPAITKHLRNIFDEGELDEDSVCSKMEHTARDGKTYKTNFYDLDAIIAVGYRVNSKKATEFRIWATKTLKEYITKGFVLDDDLLKNGTRFGIDYFEELLERIREIRASERRFYQKITDIYALSFDYNKDAEITKEFFSSVQNKFHYAITNFTAPELLVTRIDSDKPHMGLTNWKDSPDGKITLKDVTIAKNVLTEKEINRLNRLVEMFLNRAEFLATEGKPMSMTDWAKELDDFLNYNNLDILEGKGTISRKDANEKVKIEYEKFRPIQDKNYISDFDKSVKKVLGKKRNKNT